jgi:hypothetical protein
VLPAPVTLLPSTRRDRPPRAKGRLHAASAGPIRGQPGRTGAILASLLRRHPHARGILVDLPGTVARADKTLADAELSGRVTLQGQSFFDPLPAGADLYLLKSVLNDWPDEETVAILRRCAEAAQPGPSARPRPSAQPAPAGRIAVLGGVAPDDAPRSLGIDMLVAGGKTSTITQFTELARQAGLEIAAARTQASGASWSSAGRCRPIKLRAERPRVSSLPNQWLHL